MKLTPDGGDASKQTHYHRMETNKKKHTTRLDGPDIAIHFSWGLCESLFFIREWRVEMVHGKKSKMFLILL